MTVLYDPSGQISIDARIAIRGLAWKFPCIAATTAPITISTALNAGDTIDGVTLAAGDHVLVKDQSSGSQNGVYIAGATPGRAWDMDQDATSDVAIDEVRGAFVYVIAGTVNGGKLYHLTNTAAATLGSTSLVWEEFTAGSGSSTVVDHGSMGATETIDLADGDWHEGTLTANLTETVQGFTVDEGSVLLFGVTQDGMGPWSITHDASIDFGGGDDQPADTGITWFIYWSGAGDSTIYGAKVGGGTALTFATPAILLDSSAAAGVATSVIRSDATIAAFDDVDPSTAAFDDTPDPGVAAFAARSDHVHGMPATPSGGGVGAILISDSPSTPLIFADLIQNEAQDDLVYADT